MLDLKDNRLSLEQRASGAGFDGHNTVVIKAGEGTAYDHRARTVTPIPAEQTTQQQFVQYYRRLPNLILRQALDGANSLRYLGEDQFNGRKHNVVTFVMPDTQQVALYVDASTALVSKYELVFTDPLRGQSASEIIFSDYASAGKLKVPQTWTWRLAGDVVARYKVNAQFNAGDTRQGVRGGRRGIQQSVSASADVEAECGEARRRRVCDSQRGGPESEHDGGRVQGLHCCSRSARHQRRGR